MRAYLGTLVSVSMAVLVMAIRAQEPTPTSSVVPKSVEVSPSSVEADVGQKIHFTATAHDASGKPIAEKPSLWFAAPFDAAGADENGTVTFYGPGEVRIGAVIGGKTGYAKVQVRPAKIARVRIDGTPESVVVGGTVKLNAVAFSASGNPRDAVSFEWISENPAILRVDSAGMVTGLVEGRGAVHVSAEGASSTTSIQVRNNPVARLSIEPQTAKGKTGDVLHFHARGASSRGASISNPMVRWSVSGEGGATVYADGAFVAEQPGTYIVTATSGVHSSAASVLVVPRDVERELDVVAHIPLQDMQAAEEWVIGNHAYLSTVADKLLVYDISDPAQPKLLSTLQVDARLINDVSTTPDEHIGVITREGASNRKNGIVFLDTSDPARLTTLSEYTETVTGGVHSAFINSHYVYVTDDATGSLRIIDFKDPKAPKEVARFQTENPIAQTVMEPFGPMSSGRYLHDLYVKDGLAYLAYWRDGLVILDVGNGIKGGSPENPKLVSQFRYDHYQMYGDGWISGTHSAFRYKNYVFIGDEVFPAEADIKSRDRIPPRGICQVIDVSNIEQPRKVAIYEIPEGGMHNFWADDDMLFVGDYGGGGRVLDISGELRGDLYRQAREIARLWTGDATGYRPNQPLTWGAQPHKGLIFFNDVNSGLWIAKLGRRKNKGWTTAPALQEKTQ